MSSSPVIYQNVNSGGIMKVPFSFLFTALLCVYPGLTQNISAQETTLAHVPISAEAIKIAEYPLKFDPELGVSWTRLGEGKLYQTELSLVEIPPGGQIPPSRHLSEEIIYIVSGEGYTEMWVRPDEKPRRYEWSTGDALSPSLNAWHQHVNSSSDTPARYVSMRSTPLSRNLFHDEEFLTGSEYVFEERWQIGITQQAQYKGTGTMDLMAGHYIPDLPGRTLQAARGSFGITTRPNGDFAGNRIMQLLVREYQNDGLLPLDGHTHPWEVVYFVLEGEGATLLKKDNEPARIVNWEKGDMYIVEANEYHDNGGRIGADNQDNFPRIMQMRASGYFFGVGNVGEEDHSAIDISE